MKITENQVQKTILDFLELKGIYAIRVQSGSAFGSYGGNQWRIKMAPRGTPDIVVCHNGRFIGIEVKKDEKAVKTWHRKVDNYKKTSLIPSYCQREIDQYKASLKIKENGGEFYVVCSIEEVQKILQ